MKKSSIAVIGLFLLLYILPLGVRPIVIPDESRYAKVAREMLVSGDWVVPHLNGVRYFEKPVLDYWLNALSVMLFGENAFAIRFPSAVAVGVSALILFLLVKRFAGGYSAGLLAAAVLLTCLEVFGVGTFSVLDSTFSMFATAAMVSFFFAYMEWRPKKGRISRSLRGLLRSGVPHQGIHRLCDTGRCHRALLDMGARVEKIGQDLLVTACICPPGLISMGSDGSPPGTRFLALFFLE